MADDFGVPKKPTSVFPGLTDESELRDKFQEMEEQERDAAASAREGLGKPPSEEPPDPAKDHEEVLAAMLAETSNEEVPPIPAKEETNTAEYGGAQPDQPPTPDDGAKTGDDKSQAHLPLLSYVNIQAMDWFGRWHYYLVHGYRESSSSSSCSQSSFSPASSQKLAIVPILKAGKKKWISWFCAEEPEARFFDTIEVPINIRGHGSIIIPDEFVQSVDFGIKVISAVSSSVPAAIAARVVGNKVRVQVSTPLFSRLPSTVRVRIQGKRKDSPGRWEEKSEEVAHTNNAFWRQAYERVESDS